MRRYLPTLVALLLVAAACGDGEASPATSIVPATSTTAGTPVATTAPTSTPPAREAPVAATITTADGLDLDATIYPGGSSWVVLAHMRPADKTSWFDLAEALQAEGLTVVAYNNRGYGGSGGDREPFELRLDAEAVLDHAAAEGASSIAFGGASMNGAAAMDLAGENELAAVFTLSAVPSFPSVENATSRLSDVTEPILFVAAEDDGRAADDARGFAEAASRSELIVLDVGGHGTAMLDSDPGLTTRLVEWLVAAFSGV